MTIDCRAGNELRLALFGVACLAAALMAGRAFAQTAELESGRARWQAAEIGRYEYGYNKFCECHRETPPETVVTVHDGTIVRVHHLHDDSSRQVPAREGSLDLYWTVEDLFSLIESATARAATVRVSYDEELGYPTRLYVDYYADMVGDEVDVRLTRFNVIDR